MHCSSATMYNTEMKEQSDLHGDKGGHAGRGMYRHAQTKLTDRRKHKGCVKKSHAFDNSKKAQREKKKKDQSLC